MPDITAVLVVEDEALVRMDMAEFLAEQGYAVFEAATADAAIAILEANDAIRLILTDIDMPGTMDGLKLAAAVRDRWPPVRIIVMSGHRVVEVADLPAGSVFFAKPYQQSKVAIAMRELLA